MTKVVSIYTDGGSRNIGKPNMLGGWGFVANANGNNIWEDRGSDPELKTNNQNEIYAVVAALKAIDGVPNSVDIDVYSDSAYVVNCINDKWYVNWKNNGWKNSKKKPVANKELWEELISQIERVENISGATVTFKKVKGHSGDEWNEYADHLVNLAMDEVEDKNGSVQSD